MPTPSLVKLNRLEKTIVEGEASVEDARWMQAKEVVRLLDAGMKQREIAAGWINGTTREPYKHNHVGFCARVWKRFGYFNTQDRPDWTTAYYTVQQSSDEIVQPDERRQQWSEAHEVRAPSTPEAAEKFVQNVIAKAPAKVRDTIYEGLRAHRFDLPVTERERKERRAAGDEMIRPLQEAVDRGFTKLELVSSLEEATELLHDMVERQSLDPKSMKAIQKAADDFFAELEVATAMFGVEA